MAIVEKITRGGHQPAHSFTPPGVGGYVPPDLLRTNSEQARRLLAEAGFPGGPGLPPPRVIFNRSRNHPPIPAAVPGMWRRAAGPGRRTNNHDQADPAH